MESQSASKSWIQEWSWKLSPMQIKPYPTSHNLLSTTLSFACSYTKTYGPLGAVWSGFTLFGAMKNNPVGSALKYKRQTTFAEPPKIVGGGGGVTFDHVGIAISFILTIFPPILVTSQQSLTLCKLKNWRLLNVYFLENGENLDEILQNAAFYQNLHCLLR